MAWKEAGLSERGPGNMMSSVYAQMDQSAHTCVIELPIKVPLCCCTELLAPEPLVWGSGDGI